MLGISHSVLSSICTVLCATVGYKVETRDTGPPAWWWLTVTQIVALPPGRGHWHPANMKISAQDRSEHCRVVMFCSLLYCGPSVLIMHDCHLAIMHANPGIAGTLSHCSHSSLRQNHLHSSWRFYLFQLFPLAGSVMSLYIYPGIRPGAADKQQTYQKLKIVPTTIVSVTSDKLQQCQIFEGIYTPISPA